MCIIDSIKTRRPCLQWASKRPIGVYNSVWDTNLLIFFLLFLCLLLVHFLPFRWVLCWSIFCTYACCRYLLAARPNFPPPHIGGGGAMGVWKIWRRISLLPSGRNRDDTRRKGDKIWFFFPWCWWLQIFAMPFLCLVFGKENSFPGVFPPWGKKDKLKRQSKEKVRLVRNEFIYTLLALLEAECQRSV